MTIKFDDTLYHNRYRYESSTDDINLFLKKYEASAELSKTRMYYRRKPLKYDSWVASGTPIPFDLEVEREPMVEMQIPQDKFRDLVERERWLNTVEKEADYYKSLVDQYRKDERVRDSNPAVAKAWRNYLTLLELAR